MLCATKWRMEQAEGMRFTNCSVMFFFRVVLNEFRCNTAPELLFSIWCSHLFRVAGNPRQMTGQ